MSPSEAPEGRKPFSAIEEEEGTAGGLQGNCTFRDGGLSPPEGASHVPHLPPGGQHQPALPLLPSSALCYADRATPFPELVTASLEHRDRAFVPLK